MGGTKYALTIYFLITAVRWRSCLWLRSLRRTRSGSSTRPTSELWRGTPGWEQQQSSPLLWHPGREAAQPPPHPDQVRRLINDFWSTKGFFSNLVDANNATWHTLNHLQWTEEDPVWGPLWPPGPTATEPRSERRPSATAASPPGPSPPQRQPPKKTLTSRIFEFPVPQLTPIQ